MPRGEGGRGGRWRRERGEGERGGEKGRERGSKGERGDTELQELPPQTDAEICYYPPSSGCAKALHGACCIGPMLGRNLL